MDFEPFPLLDWIGTHGERAKNAAIATSGVLDFPMSALPFDLKAMDLLALAAGGHSKVVLELAKIYGAEPERIVETTGASEANFLALAALADRGERVVIETPTYGSFPAIAKTLRLNVAPLERDFRMGFALDLERLKRVARKPTRVVVLTNLHNPSGVAIPRGTLRAALEIAQDAGGVLYVDEIFRDFADGVPSVAELGGRAVAVGSMSKLYGLGWTRVGWMVAPDEKAAKRLRRARALASAGGTAVGGLVAAWALANQQRFIRRAKEIVAQNYEHLTRWSESLRGIVLVPPEGAPICFPQVRLPKGKTTEGIAKKLLESQGILTTPGELFGRPGHFRLGCGGDPEKTRAALEALAKELATPRKR